MQEAEFLEVYEYIQGKISGNPGFQYNKPIEAKKKIRIFLQENPTVTDIFDFITFISVLRTSKYNRYTIIPFSQYTSKNAAKLYKEKTPQQDYFIRKFQFRFELRNPLLKQVGLSTVYLDSQRKRYFDTPKGFLKCSSYEGFLYDTEKCKGCRYTYICGNK